MDLATARDDAALIEGVAAALELPLRGRELAAAAGRALAERGAMLLVLDNLEQIAASAPAVLAGWLQGAPQLRLLATSRVRLELDGATAVAVAPLQPLAAAEMFAQIARRSRPGFRLSPHNLQRVLDVVGELDHLPLSIELAAARVGTLGLDGVRAGLADRFALLRGRLRDPAARALQGALEASWALLSPAEQRALAACSVFRGGWSLEAAQDVLAEPGAPPVADLLDALVDDHLIVRAEPDGAAPRYTMLVSIRDFAAQKLTARDAVLRRHAAHYAGLRERAERAGDGKPDAASVYPLLRQEQENLEVGLAAPDEALALACGKALFPLYADRGPFLRGARSLEALLGRLTAATPAAQRGRVTMNVGLLLRQGGDPAGSREAFQRAAVLAEESGDGVLQATVTGQLGMLLHSLGALDESEALLTRARDLHRENGNQPGYARALSSLGTIRRERGDIAAARTHYEQALEIYRAQQNARSEGVALANLATLHREQGETDIAWARYREARAAFQAAHNRYMEGNVVGGMGSLLWDLGEPDRGQVLLEQALVIHREVGNRHSEGGVLINLGGLHASQGRAGPAMDCFQRARAILQQLGDRNGEAYVTNSIGDLLLQSGDLAGARAHLREAAALFEAVLPWGVGCSKGSLALIAAQEGDLDAARALLAEGAERLRGRHNLELGKLLCKRGTIEHSAGDLEAARAALDEAAAIAAAARASDASPLGAAVARLRDLLSAP